MRGIFAFLGQLGAGELRANDPGLYDIGVGRNEVLRVIGFEPARGGDAVAAPGIGSVRLTGAASVPPGEVDGAEMSDESHRSVQLLSEFMALYSSAKSLPAPNVIPFFTP